MCVTALVSGDMGWLFPDIGGAIMERNLSALCYPYRRLHHGAQRVYSLLLGFGGSFMELVIRNLTCIHSVLLMLMDVSRKLNHDL